MSAVIIRLLADLATTQHGRVARWQLLLAGVHPSTIDRLVASGHLIVELPGVYAVGHAARAPLSHLASRLLAAGPAAASSHETSAWHQGLLRSSPGTKVHVAVPRKAPRRVDGAVVHRLASLQEDEVEVVHGLRTTTVARLLVDTCATRPTLVRKLVGEAERRNRLDMVQIARVHAHISRPRGIRSLYLALGDPEPLLRSSNEEKLLTACELVRAIRPRTNHRVRIGPGDWVEVDAYWPEVGLVVEVDARFTHGGRVAGADDVRRQLRLERAGHVVRRIWDTELDAGLVAAGLRILAWLDEAGRLRMLEAA